MIMDNKQISIGMEAGVTYLKGMSLNSSEEAQEITKIP
jgi:hypothetical protein